MSENELRGRATKKEKNLNVSFGAAEPSPASSNRTMISPRSPDGNGGRFMVRRRRTQVAVVKVSWWDCFKGFLLGPKNVERKIAATTKIEFAEDEDAGEEIFDEKNCPFIVTVSAFPRDSRETSEIQALRCMLDTACQQGNIISEPLARRLGFQEFEPLSSRESNGGSVATGHIHHVIGAIHLTWFHNTSPKMYNDMRFLVSKTADVELVVGAQSILRNSLISPPNLGITDLPLKPEPERENLVQEQATVKSNIEDKEAKIDELGAGNDPKKKETLDEANKSLVKLRKKFDELQVQIKHCDDIADAKRTLSQTTTDDAKKALTLKIEYLRQQLEEYKRKKDKKAARKKDDKVDGKKDDRIREKSGKM